MRLEELKLRVGHDELRVGFHDRLTVVGGMGEDDRNGFVDLVMNAWAGRGDDPTELVVFDALGNRQRVSYDPATGVARTHDDGTPAPDLLAGIGMEEAELRTLCHVRAGEIEKTVRPPSQPLPPEVAEAHAALAGLDAEIAAALERRQRVAGLAAEMAEIDEQLEHVEDLAARSAYAGLLAQIERLRAEIAALEGGEEEAQADADLAGAAKEIRTLGRRWRKIADLLARATADFADHHRLDPDLLRRALAAPPHLPPNLDLLVQRVEAAEAERDRLAARLAALAADQLPAPSHPAVVQLAKADQDTVWSACERASVALAQLQHASLELGGVDTVGGESEIVGELEAAHDEVEAAAAAHQSRRAAGVAATAVASTFCAVFGLVLSVVPVAMVAGGLAAVAAVAWLLLPWLRLRRATAAELRVLDRVGVSSYLAFHMRRIDATIDPQTRDRVVESMREHQRALDNWALLSGGLTPGEARQLEPEVHEYATALYGLDGAVDEIEGLHDRLTSVAEPALEAARTELLAVCRPYGAQDAATAAATVRRHVALHETARLQATLEELEEDEATLRGRLEALLATAGFAGGDTAAALGEFETAASAAEERVKARKKSRPADAVRAELLRYQAEAESAHRPHWGTVPPAAGDAGVSEDGLLARRAELEAELAAPAREATDLDRLHDRRDALARRVAVLEAQAGIVSCAVTGADIEPQLLARLDACRRAGGTDESPVVFLDEVFRNAPAEDKWLLLDVVEREAATVQAVYLTDDPDVIVWARRRAGVGSVTLLEPEAEPV